MSTIVDETVEHGGGPGRLTVVAADAEVAATDWAEVHQRASRIAAVLIEERLGPGCRIGLLADTSVELVATLQGVWLAGGAITVLPLPARPDQRGYAGQLLNVITDAGLDLVVVDDHQSHLLPVLAAATRVLALDVLVERAAGTPPAAPRRPDPTDLAVLQYTSGSTRVPRGARWARPVPR